MRKAKHWNEINRSRLTFPATSNIPIHTLQPYNIVAKRFTPHAVGFLELPLTKDLVKTLKIWWMTNYFSKFPFFFVRLLENSKRPLRYLTCVLCEFTCNLEKSFKLLAIYNFLVTLQASSWDILNLTKGDI